MKIWLKNIARKDFKPTKYITSTAESIQAELLFNVFPNENDAAIIFLCLWLLLQINGQDQ